MAKVQDIPFRQIPHQSKLFLDYLDLSPDALRFYDHPPTMDRLIEFARSGIAGVQFARKEISAVLRAQNKGFGTGPDTFRSIEQLESADSVAVLTGQQVGLFVSPLYTIYKAVTALHIARELTERGINAVPVFWMATEDHDLAEVTRRTVSGPNQTIERIERIDYRPIIFGDSGVAMRPVGSLRFPESVKEAVADYVSRLDDSDWKPAIQQQLNSCYHPGATMGAAFGRLMARIFEGTGLILFDPDNSEAKQLTADVIRRAILDAHKIRESLERRNHGLESAGFHSQVNVLENSTVLFVVDAGERRALETQDPGFGLKGSGRTFKRDELLKMLEQSPEIFSPNVLLRSLVQDHLFPTVAYVGGSSELAYFAQVETLYRFFRRPMPVIWPRNSFTLIEPAAASEMDQFGFVPQDLFSGRSAVMDMLTAKTGALNSTGKLEELQRRLDHGLDEIRPVIEAVEPTLARALETAKRKIRHNVQHLTSRLVHLEAQNNSLIPDVTNRIMNSCFPNENLQERELDYFSFFARHGPSLLETIQAAAEPANFAHRVVWL